MLLEVRDLSVFYGAIQAVKGISFDVGEGEIVTLIGANGAGKSTTLKAISGMMRPKSGSIKFKGSEVTTRAPHTIVAEGMAHVPEGRRMFANLTVHENLLLGAFTVNDRNAVSKNIERVFARFPRLKERINQPSGTLSGGEQQMLAMGRGLMSQPKLMMLDEPSMGLSPILVQQVFDIIREINQTGTSILLVEQNAFMALQIASRAYVLETGHIVLSGAAADLQKDPKVRAAYLGDVVEV
ncbi:MAG: ABC transporter ATP-binding protein [Planctomycetaceae bacterium]|nr:MAG: ABC transporter ATP-binding protein [Planctomycetaceae bacterium]